MDDEGYCHFERFGLWQQSALIAVMNQLIPRRLDQKLVSAQACKTSQLEEISCTLAASRGFSCFERSIALIMKSGLKSNRKNRLTRSRLHLPGLRQFSSTNDLENAF